MLSTCYLCGVVRSTAHTQGTRMGLTCKTHTMNQSCHDRGQLTWSPGDPKTPLIPDIPPTSSNCGQKSRGQPLDPAWMDGGERQQRKNFTTAGAAGTQGLFTAWRGDSRQPGSLSTPSALGSQQEGLEGASPSCPPQLGLSPSLLPRTRLAGFCPRKQHFLVVRSWASLKPYPFWASVSPSVKQRWS